MHPTPSPYLLVQRLLQRLQQEGRTLGVDEHLRLQQLLGKLPQDLPPDRLASHITPLLARKPEEQTHIYQLLQELAKEKPEHTGTGEGGEKKPPPRWLYLLGALLAIGLLVGGFAVWNHYQPKEVTLKTAEALPVDSLQQEAQDPNELVTPVDTFEPSILPQIVRLDTLPIDLEDPREALSAEPAWQRNFRQYEWPLKGIAILWLGLVALGLVYFLRRRRKLVARRESGQKPPFSWAFSSENPPTIEMEEQLGLITTQLRGREASARQRMDLPATIKATLKKGGQLSLRYKQHSRPAEYLVLINRRSDRNHQAQLFNLLCSYFRTEEVHLERFYYDGDPRLLWNEQIPGGLSLPELQARFPEHRLLLFDQGYRLLSGRTGQLAPWAHFFMHWPYRAILSPQSPQSWGKRESQLARYFQLLPAGLEGLRELVATLEGATTRSPEHWKEQPQALPPIQLQTDQDLIESLSQHYDEAMLRWIAACALWPALHWDLSLELGRLLDAYKPADEGQQGLLTLPRIYQFSRLPWMIQGEIPPVARHQLLAWLDQNDPGLSDTLRGGIHSLMQQGEPPEGSAAHDDYRMQIVVNQLLRKDISPEERKAAEQEFERLAMAGVEHDFTILEYLDRPKSALDFIVPKALRKLVYRQGKAFWGWKESTWALPSWAIVSLVILLIKPPAQQIDTQLAQQWDAYQAIQAQDHQKADSLIPLAFPIYQEVSLPDRGAERLDSLALDKMPFLPPAAYLNEAIKAWDAQDSLLANSLLDYSLYWGRLPDTSGRASQERLWRLLHPDTVAVDTPEVPSQVADTVPAVTNTVAAETTDVQPQVADTVPDVTDTPPAEKDSTPTLPIPRMKSIPGDTFLMGSTSEDPDAQSDEQPQHPISISTFEMGVYEVTNEQYCAFLNAKDNQEEGGLSWYDPDGEFRDVKARIQRQGDRWVVDSGYAKHPVIYVSWYGARAYGNWLNEVSGKKGWRLPTEAEWEYAAGGGMKDRNSDGSRKYPYAGGDNLDSYGWYSSNSGSKMHPVGQKRPNGLGLYDMSGNVWEWCQDKWHDNYEGAPTNGQAWESGSSTRRVLRGGSWSGLASLCRVADRFYVPGLRRSGIGFRLSRTL